MKIDNNKYLRLGLASYYNAISYIGSNRYLAGRFSIIESVDSISRDGPDTPIYVIHYKRPNNLGTDTISRFISYINMIFS